MAAISLLAIALAVLYWLPLRKWFGSWGTTPEDLVRVMSGDAAVVDPSCVPSTLGWWLFLRVVEPAAFLMTRRMLLGLKRRAEAPAVAAQSRHAA